MSYWVDLGDAGVRILTLTPSKLKLKGRSKLNINASDPTILKLGSGASQISRLCSLFKKTTVNIHIDRTLFHDCLALCFLFFPNLLSSIMHVGLLF